MPASRIVVRPMNRSALFVPDIFTVKANAVADRESADARGDVDVVCDKECLSGRELNDESLMSRTFLIVRQKADHLAPCTSLVLVANARLIASPTGLRVLVAAF